MDYPQTTPFLNLPMLHPGQARKYVTHNEALNHLDAVVQTVVEALNLNEPPETASEPARYGISNTPTGEWAEQAGKIAVWDGHLWSYISPFLGWTIFVRSSETLHLYNGEAWVPLQTSANDAGGQMANPTTLSIGGAALNPSATLSVRGAQSILSSDPDTTPDDMRLTLNRTRDMGGVTSIILQENWTTLSEIGSFDEAPFAVKVADTNGTLKTAICVEQDRVVLGGDDAASAASAGTDGIIYLPIKNTASIPPASSVGAGALAYVSNIGANGQLAYCDGLNWRSAVTGAVID